MFRKIKGMIGNRTLEEKIQLVKEQAAKEKWDGRANIVYIVIALKRGWEDAARYFLDQYVEEFFRKEGYVE